MELKKAFIISGIREKVYYKTGQSDSNSAIFYFEQIDHAKNSIIAWMLILVWLPKKDNLIKKWVNLN